jgi:hypothetical protein
MTNNRYPALRRDITAPKSHRAMHEHYVRAINWALEAGRDSDAYELADAYAKDLGATETRVSEPVA